MKSVGLIFIGILMQGESAKPVRVRSYWRVRNGRKEFVRAHYRRRQLTPGWFILELALYRIRGLEQCSRKPSHKGGFRHCLQARTPVRRPSDGQRNSVSYRAPPCLSPVRGERRELCRLHEFLKIPAIIKSLRGLCSYNDRITVSLFLPHLNQ